MSKSDSKSQSPFAAAALAFDAELMDFLRLTREIEKVSVQSDGGLDRGTSLLGDAAESRRRLSEKMATFAEAFNYVRDENDKAEALILEKSRIIGARQEQSARMLEKYKQFGEMVKQVNTAIKQLRETETGELAPQDRAELTDSLAKFDAHLTHLVEEARKLMTEAHDTNMKTVERNADSLRQTLQSAQHRVRTFIAREGSGEAPPTIH